MACIKSAIKTLFTWVARYEKWRSEISINFKLKTSVYDNFDFLVKMLLWFVQHFIQVYLLFLLYNSLNNQKTYTQKIWQGIVSRRKPLRLLAMMTLGYKYLEDLCFL